MVAARRTRVPAAANTIFARVTSWAWPMRLDDPDDWGFARYHASTRTYIDSRLPNGAYTGTPHQALDTAARPLPQRPRRLNSNPAGLTRSLARYCNRPSRIM